MKALLKKLMQNSVSFDDYDTNALSKIEACFAPGSCDGVNARAYCARDDEVSTPAGIKCKLRIPSHRLMGPGSRSEPKMESLFYSRLADELIRYARMRDFMFTERPNDYYLTSRIPKVVCENELILTQSMIDGTGAAGNAGNDGFFKNEANQPDADKAKNLGISVNTSAFNLKRKKVTEQQKYTRANEEQFSTVLQKRKEVVKMAPPSSMMACLSAGHGTYTMTVFQGIFPGDVQDERIVKNGDITFALFVNILHLQKKLEPREDVAAVKQKLVEAYNDVMGGDKRHLSVSKICNLWTKCGIQMNRLAKEIMDGKLTIQTAIQSPVYTLTPFDMWLLSMAYEVQIILFSGSNIEEPIPVSSRFYCNGNGCKGRVLFADADTDPNSEYFVVVTQTPMNQFPVYGLVQGEATTSFSIHAKDINFDVSSVYRTNELIADFIENISVAPAAAATAAATPKMQKQISVTDSLPLIQMKQKGQQLSAVSEEDSESESEEESEEEEEEVHDPNIKALLEKSRSNLDSALTRLSNSSAATSDVRQKSYSDKEKVDKMKL
jgi:hypothetical protein